MHRKADPEWHPPHIHLVFFPFSRLRGHASSDPLILSLTLTDSFFLVNQCSVRQRSRRFILTGTVPLVTIYYSYTR